MVLSRYVSASKFQKVAYVLTRVNKRYVSMPPAGRLVVGTILIS